MKKRTKSEFIKYHAPKILVFLVGVVLMGFGYHQISDRNSSVNLTQAAQELVPRAILFAPINKVSDEERVNLKDIIKHQKTFEAMFVDPATLYSQTDGNLSIWMTTPQDFQVNQISEVWWSLVDRQTLQGVDNIKNLSLTIFNNDVTLFGRSNIDLSGPDVRVQVDFPEYGRYIAAVEFKVENKKYSFLFPIEVK